MRRVPARRLLVQLAALKTQFSRADAAKILSILKQLAHRDIHDAELLAEYHEILLFLRSYPYKPSIVRLTEGQLKTFAQRTAQLIERGEDYSSLEHPEMSGIAGLPLIDTFSYDIAKWLFHQHASDTSLDWEWFEDDNRLGETWPSFMPLLEEDAFVEAHVPYREWLRRAKDGGTEFSWLLTRFAELEGSEEKRAQIFNSQKIYIRWLPKYPASRTGLRLQSRQIFYHQAPLIQRRDVSLRSELSADPPSIKLLDMNGGKKILDAAREASTTRYRELYGFTYGDPKSVLHTLLGRGVDLFVMSLPPERRLPLRAYHSAMMFKNGVPVGYFEGLSLFERMESGFNLYYTFREGETAWLYARTLNVISHVTGVRAFSLDPYQVGHENEEGIESGAFWFYRKLGFRPVQPSIMALTEKEERKLATRKSYRTSASMLRKLAAGPMILELDQEHVGDWDRFSTRNIGLAVQRRMADEFDGSSIRMRRSAVKWLGRLLGVDASTWQDTDSHVFADFACVLLLIDGVNQWSAEEKRLLMSIIRAKSTSDEATYLRRMRQHSRLRDGMLGVGSPTEED